MIEFLRLGAATAAVLLPGALVARALGGRSVAEALLWSLALVFAGSALAFALAAPFWVVAAVVFGAALVAAPVALRRRHESARSGRGIVLAAGVLFGIALWQVLGEPAGDGLFHLARVRKLLAFDDLSLGAVNEFADGGLHPGYAFPLWHAFLGLIAWTARVDPTLVVTHEAALLAPVAFLVVYEAGVALFRSAWLGGAVVAGQLALSSLASSHGGAFASLALPATASRLLIVPAVLAVVFAHLREPRRSLLAATAAGGLALTLVHPTYTIFLALPLGGFLLARALAQVRVPSDKLSLGDTGRLAASLAAFLVPAAGAMLWLLPVVRETVSYRPGADERERALAHYASQLDVFSDTAYRLAPEVLARSGSLAVAALFLVPLAALAAGRRWASWVLGGSLAVLAVVLLPELFVRLSDAVSLSQSRRAAGFLPFAFAFAGGAAVLARLTGPAVVGIGLAAGVALQLAVPGSFGRELGEGGGPGWLAWYALAGAVVGVAAGFLAPRVDRRGMLAGLACLAFVAPVAAHAATVWTVAEHRRAAPLTPGLVEALREEVPEGAVVFSDLETSYRIGALAPVYVAANPPAHVADTERNRPYARRRDVVRFLRTGDLSIPRGYGAGWLVVDTSRFDLEPDLPVVYRGGRYALYRLAA